MLVIAGWSLFILNKPMDTEYIPIIPQWEQLAYYRNAPILENGIKGSKWLIHVSVVERKKYSWNVWKRPKPRVSLNVFAGLLEQCNTKVQCSNFRSSKIADARCWKFPTSFLSFLPLTLLSSPNYDSFEMQLVRNNDGAKGLDKLGVILIPRFYIH